MYTCGLKCEIAIACGGEGDKKKGKFPPFEATAKRRQAFVELLLLDQQLWHTCLSDQVTQLLVPWQVQRVNLSAA